MMAVQKEMLQKYLRSAFRKKEFKLEKLNGTIPKELSEGLALAKTYSESSFKEFLERMDSSKNLDPRLNNRIVHYVRQRLARESFQVKIQDAFISSGVFVDHRFNDNHGMILDTFDVIGIPMHLVLTDSYADLQKGGRSYLNGKGSYITVNVTTAAGRACSAIAHWMEVDGTKTESVDDATSKAWDALDCEPETVLAANAWGAVLWRINLLAQKAQNAEEFVADAVELFTLSSAVHEAAHVIESRKNGSSSVFAHERCAYSLQAIYSDPGIALWLASERGILGKLFPELVEQTEELGKEALGKGVNWLRVLAAGSLDDDFKRVHGKPHNEVLDISVLNELSSTRLIQDKNAQLVRKALHLPG